MFNIPKNTNNGFTLIETLLYLAIASSILLVISLFLSVMLQARVKYQAITEVEQQGVFVMRTITQMLRNSQTINSPTPGNSGGQLSVNSTEAPENPVVYQENAGGLTQKIGSQTAVDLLSPNVSVSNLSFTNLSGAGSSAVLRITFTLSYMNPSNRNEFSYSANFYDSANLNR